MAHAFDRALFIKALWQAKLDRLVTPNAYLIGRALLRRASRAGECWPSLDTLAADVGCCARTAGAAVASLRRHGLLDWRRRRMHWKRMASNLYRLALPQKDKRISLESSVARLAEGSLPDGVAAALARLGTALGVAPGQVMPWLGLG